MEIIFVNFMALAGLKAKKDARLPHEAWEDELHEQLGLWAVNWIQAGHPNGVWFLDRRAVARYVGVDELIHASFPKEILFVHIPEFGRILVQKSRHTPTDVRGTLAHYDAAVLTLADRAIP